MLYVLFIEYYLMLKSYELGFRSSMQEGVHISLLIFETSSMREIMSVVYCVVAI